MAFSKRIGGGSGGTSGARLHTESLRVGVTPTMASMRAWHNRLRTHPVAIHEWPRPETCFKCGKPALYRVYGRDATETGACASHRSELHTQTPYFSGR